MLKFKEIEYRNLLSVGNVPITIKLDNNESHLIIGQSGAGKSLFLDAISYLLFNKPYRNINKPNLINSINKKDLLVEGIVETNGKEFNIRRGMKPNIFEIYCDGILINPPADTYDYQEMLEKDILKMDYKTFVQTVILGSAQYQPFLNLPLARRRAIIEDLLDLQVFSSMNVALKEEISETKMRISDLNRDIDSAEDKIKFIRDNLSKILRNTSELIDSKNEQIEAYKNQYNETFEVYKQLKIDIETYEDKYNFVIKNVNEKREKALNLKHKVTERRNSITKDLNFFEHTSNCPTCSQNINDEHKYNIITQKSESLKDLDSAFEQIQIKLNQYKEKLESQDSIKKEIESMKASFHTSKTTCNHIIEVLKSMKAEVKKLQEQHEETESNSDQIVDIQKKLDSAIVEREELLEKTKIQKISSIILKDSGLKAQKIKEYVPIINQYINKYLGDLDFFVQFELNENFEETIKSNFRDGWSYDAFSQGEKFRIDLAIILTLRAVAKIRNSCVSNLLIMDEIFDAALGSSDIDNCVGLIEKLIFEGSTIFIISHRSDLIDKFSNTMQLTKKGHFTTLEVI